MHILVQLEKKSEVDCLFEKLLKRDHPKNSESSCKPDSRKTMHESLSSFVYLSLGNESEKVEQNIRKTWESDVTEECKQYQSFRHDWNLFTWETSSYISIWFTKFWANFLSNFFDCWLCMTGNWRRKYRVYPGWRRVAAGNSHEPTERSRWAQIIY